MITMTMTRHAAEAVRGAVGALPVGEQANVEAYQAVTAALEKDDGQVTAGDLGDLDAALARGIAAAGRLSRFPSPGAAAITDAGPRTFPVYLSAADIGELSRVVRGHQPWNETPAWAVRVLAALRGAR